MNKISETMIQNESVRLIKRVNKQFFQDMNSGYKDTVKFSLTGEDYYYRISYSIERVPHEDI